MGRLDNNSQATPARQPDRLDQAVGNKQKLRQINAQDVVTERQEAAPPEDQGPSRSGVAPDQPAHSMLEEEPLGWDQAPMARKRPEERRHPRTEGKGGTP